MSRCVDIIISDFDGVLADTVKGFSVGFAQVLKGRGIGEEELRQTFLQTTSRPIREQIALIFNGQIPPKEAIALEREIFRVIEKYDVVAFPAVKGTLDQIKGRGKMICVSSGARTHWLKQMFANFAWPIDCCLGSNRFLKGDDHITWFAKWFRLARKDFCARTLYVGDGTRDMEIALKNGLLAVGVEGTVSADQLRNAGANEVIGSFSEILRLL